MVKKKFYIKPSCTITLAAKIVKIARDYNVEIIIYDSGKEAKAEDIMKILILPSFLFFDSCYRDEQILQIKKTFKERIKKPSGEIEIEVKGENAKIAIKELEKIFNGI